MEKNAMTREAVIVDSLRTGLAKAHRGSFNIEEPVNYLAHTLRSVAERVEGLDTADIEDVIASTGYYPPQDASVMDGTFIVAENKEGQLMGCLWIMHYGRNAYLDYLAVRPQLQHSGMGIRLLIKAREVLKRRGVRFVRSVIKLDNTEALRIAPALGAMTHGPYALTFNDLGAQ
jgi:ribosomal protein S18 acetylase RimI-like enzyme